MTDTQAAQSDTEEESHHPGVSQYVEIGIILAVLTALEVALYFVPVPRAVAIPSLLVLTALKFALVVLWFMHLRFDSAWFRRVFGFGLVLACVVFGITYAVL